jgi:SPX domain protein involved in polyphosphate accumulation
MSNKCKICAVSYCDGHPAAIKETFTQPMRIYAGNTARELQCILDKVLDGKISKAEGFRLYWQTKTALKEDILSLKKTQQESTYIPTKSSIEGRTFH